MRLLSVLLRLLCFYLLFSFNFVYLSGLEVVLPRLEPILTVTDTNLQRVPWYSRALLTVLDVYWCDFFGPNRLVICVFASRQILRNNPHFCSAVSAVAEPINNANHVVREVLQPPVRV